MKYFGLRLVTCLVAVIPAIHATSIDPLKDGFGLTVGSTTLSDANASFNSLTGVLSFSDGTATYTFAEVNDAPLVDALTLTRTCITLNLSGCSAKTVSVSNANVLNGTFQASALLNVSLAASTQAGISNLVFAQTSSALGVETAVGGYSPSAVSPTPEPSSLALLGTGLLGIACAARRKFASVSS